jgi:hypothetical protein
LLLEEAMPAATITKRKLVKFSKSIEAAQATFRAKIEKLAELARTEILPYFREHKWDFIAGNGTWYVTRPEREVADDLYVTVDDDELPEDILGLLMLEVGRSDHLGFYIREIKRGGR